MDADWKFDDDPNTTCFTTTFVLDGSPIQRVYHDYDGDWQFHGSPDQPATNAVIKLVCLAEMIRIDPSLNQLHDLPFGWRAERTTSTGQWKRFKNNPFPDYDANGYYLEDAEWLSRFLPDIIPPDSTAIEALSEGDYVKLVFRFAAEDAERDDYQCERMWVLIVGWDEDENFIGTIGNDPHHESANYGDKISFHTLHIAEINAD